MSKLDYVDLSKEINNLLNARPKEGQKRNIVFWFDSDAEFIDKLDSLDIENGKVVLYTGHNYFNVKYLLEIEDIASNYLVYAPIKKPNSLDNYLYDIMLYSTELIADITTIYMRELGITLPEMVDEVKKYNSFLKNADRRRRLKNLLLGDITPQKFHISVLSVLAKLTVIDFDKALMAIISDYFDNKTENKIITDILKYCDLDALNDLIYAKYGIQKAFDNIEELTVKLFLQHMSFTAAFKLPLAWQINIQAGSELWRNNSYILIDNFAMSNYKKNYEQISEFVAEKIELKRHINNFEIEDFLTCETFVDFDDFIIEKINHELLNNVHDYPRYISIVSNRKSYFLENKKNDYEALSVACKFFAGVEELKSQFRETTVDELFKNYAKNYERIDNYYRRFSLYFDRADNENLSELAEKIEAVYTNWFLPELSSKWTSLTKDKVWGKDIYDKQWYFYEQNIKSFVRSGERVVVIISDGLRYEIGVDLSKRISNAFKAKVEIKPMIGVLPSYTELGMAALLPHNNITFTEKANVFLDGINSNGMENRAKILDSYEENSCVFTAKDFLSMQRPKLKEIADGKKVFYIFHNQIDAVGDNIPTESQVFEASENAIDEIIKIITKLKNDLTITNIFITSDHGFIYKRASTQELNKTIVENKDNIKFKRRFILTKKVESDISTYAVPMKYLMQESDLMSVLPFGYNVFHKQGESSRYVHGGGSLQEVTIPLIKYYGDRSKNKANEVRSVRINIISMSRKITSLVTYLDFFQTEKVSEKVVAKQFKVYFVDDNGQVISNSIFINADSKSDNDKDRTKREKFTFKSMVYDKNKRYYLIIEDEDNQYAEKTKEQFQIDLLINNGVNF